MYEKGIGWEEYSMISLFNIFWLLILCEESFKNNTIILYVSDCGILKKIRLIDILLSHIGCVVAL